MRRRRRVSTGRSRYGAVAPPSGTADVLVSIRIPRDVATARRRVAYVSPGTASMAITVGGQTTTALCPAPATTCSASVAAPLGMQTFSIGLYDSASALLSSGSASVTIVANTVNAVNLTFDGVVASLGLSLTTTSLAVGVAGSTTLNVVAQDADGYQIVQPGFYTQPIVVSTVPALPPASTISGATTFGAIPANATALAITYTAARCRRRSPSSHSRRRHRDAGNVDVPRRRHVIGGAECVAVYERAVDLDRDDLRIELRRTIYRQRARLQRNRHDQLRGKRAIHRHREWCWFVYRRRSRHARRDRQCHHQRSDHHDRGLR